MAGYINIINAIPPILLANWSITSPLVEGLADCRILGSNDPNYGSIGWVPRLDGKRFATLETTDIDDSDKVEANRVWSTYKLDIFLAVEHANTAAANGDYDLIGLAWVESLRQVVASQRRLNSIAISLYPTAGDVQWTMSGAKEMDRRIVQGVPYYGRLCHTTIRLINMVNYQG